MANATVDGGSITAEKTSPQSYKILASFPHGISRQQLDVVFDEKYDRVPHPDADLESSVNEIWDRKVHQNKSLFNGTKFRYDGHSLRGEDSCKNCSKLCLHLGLTDYRTFVGTNLNPSWAKFIVPTDEIVVSCQHMSSPLGNGAIVETLDNTILVLRRSKNVGEFPGCFVFPGGHPEPEAVGMSTHQCDRDVDRGMVNKNISEEMFDSIIREVVEETGVPAESLSDPILIGISLREMNVRPAAFFYIKCNLLAEAVSRFYDHAQDGYESTGLFALPKSDAYDWTRDMPGCHRGGYALYELMIQAKNNV